MTDDEVMRRLKETCILLYGTDGVQGTGYIVAHGFAATANHVVLSWSDQTWYPISVGWPVVCRGTEAKVIARCKLADVAILELKGCNGITPIAVGDLPAAKTDWVAFGFPCAAAVDGVAVGLPMGGTVHDANWENQLSQPKILLNSDQAAAGQGTQLHGWSGSPVVADGRLVGHLTEQFGDPEDRSRPAYGMAKASPIDAIRKLLKDTNAVFGVDSVPLRRPVTVQVPVKALRPSDPNIIAELLAWCDRDTVVEQVNKWLQTEMQSGAGLLCLFGHIDNRPKLLLERIATELGEQDPPTKARCRYIDNDGKLNDEDSFHRSALSKLRVKPYDNLSKARDYEDGMGLVLLGVSCNCTKLSQMQIAQKLRYVSQWVNGLSLKNRRLLVVITMVYGEPHWLDRLLRRSVQERVSASFLCEQLSTNSTLGKCVVGPLIHLTDYTSDNLIDWRDKERVKPGLGRTWSALDETIIRKWFKNGARNPAELQKLLDTFHRENMIPNGRKA